jgi:glycosyltransferase involved in cell wall biosynthesis
MKIVQFVNSLGLGGTIRASSVWSRYLRSKGHEIAVLYLNDGPGKRRFTEAGFVPRHVKDEADIREQLSAFQPDVIHAHAPGFAHGGDVLGAALLGMPRRPPVVQTNIFGYLANPKETAWTDLRLFVSWTSCVQAARRHDLPLDAAFFAAASVVSCPLPRLEDGPDAARAQAFRGSLGFADDDVIFGKFSRPDPIKWSDLSIKGFRLAVRDNPKLKMLIREAPAAVLKTYPDLFARGQIVSLPMTSDPAELQMTMAGVDVVLHSSAIGESFGYGIAEPMQLGKPVIAHSIPWKDQAQIELVDHGKGGFLASTPQTTRDCILRLAGDADLRRKMGEHARERIQLIADAETSGARLEESLRAVVEGRPNPRAANDLVRALEAAAFLDRHEFGDNWRDTVVLRTGWGARRVKKSLMNLRGKLFPSLPDGGP